jgi:lipopolysaccharide biosynthesis glycosyltransferase
MQDYEEKHTDGSNQFIYSRFLVPHLMEYKGWAIFMDGDMLLRDDIEKLWALRDESKAVMIVKHDYKTKMTEKYLGSKNEDYPRKNWSSVILWNCEHAANKVVTTEFIENATGAQLHRFTWLTDDLIGELPAEWNWLDVEYDRNLLAKLVHYTLGTPCFHDNMKWIKDHGISIYLKTSEELLFKRLNNQKEGRPLISSMSDDDLKHFISIKITEREKFYEQADYTYLQWQDENSPIELEKYIEDKLQRSRS